jgi:heme O synthase-like polyprenyltransferase
MTPKTLLELGRVSNLPTVASNVLAAAALTGAPLGTLPVAVTLLAGMLFYVGGMVLNDAFDAEIDARERPERPIPSGRATRRAVFVLGFSLLGVGLALLLALVLFGRAVGGIRLFAAGTATVFAVVAYDRLHKGIAWSPVVMGLCRAGLYAMGAYAVSAAPPDAVGAAGLLLLLYVVGLTHIARFETASNVGRLWPAAFLFLPLVVAATRPTLPMIAVGALFAVWTVRGIVLAARGGRQIGRGVVSLIAGMALFDAMVALWLQNLEVGAAAVAAWALTLGLQRIVSGT